MPLNRINLGPKINVPDPTYTVSLINCMFHGSHKKSHIFSGGGHSDGKLTECHNGKFLFDEVASTCKNISQFFLKISPYSSFKTKSESLDNESTSVCGIFSHLYHLMIGEISWLNNQPLTFLKPTYSLC